MTALDVIVQRQILDVLRALQQRLKVSMVLVTHDISVVAYLCDDVVVMYAGQVVESGPVREVLYVTAGDPTSSSDNARQSPPRARFKENPCHSQGRSRTQFII